MSSVTFLRQCELVSGTTTTIGWIDEKAAKSGARLQIKDDPGIDEKTLWTVKSVGSARLPEAEAKDKERLFTRHRKATDI